MDKPKVLLINSNTEKSPWPVAPLGLCLIASYLKTKGVNVKVLDLCFSRNLFSDISQTISTFRPDWIGITIRNIDNEDCRNPIFYLSKIKEEIVDVCKRLSQADIVLGGSAINIISDEVLDFMGVRFAIVGDGEETFFKLVNGKGPEEIPGVIDATRSQISNPPSFLNYNLDNTPSSKVYKWINFKQYEKYNASYPIQTKRGCALRCIYCTHKRIEGPVYRFRSVKNIVDEIEEVVKEHNPQRLYFVDSVFNVPPEHAMSICREIIRRKIKVGFSTMGINPKYVSLDLLRLMKKAGFSEIAMTLESASEKILQNLSKDFTVQDIERAIRLCHKVDLPCKWIFMFGAPGECEGSVKETFQFIEKHLADKRRDLVYIVSGVRIHKGNELEALARSQGYIGAEESLLKPTWFRPRKITQERLFYLIDREVATHKNYLYLCSKRCSQTILSGIYRVYQLLGLKEPIWENAYYIQSIAKLLGYQRFQLWRLKRRYRFERI